MKRVYVKRDESNPSPLDLYYNVWFNSDTDCSELDLKYERALIKFPIIFSSSEASVYKICHHFYQRFNMTRNNMKIIDGLAIESYFDPFANHKYNMIRMESLTKDGILKDISGRWVVIPNMSSQWSPRLAYLFYNEIKNAEAIGLIFHSEGANNLGKVLVEDSLLNVLQFPKKVYEDMKQLEDDNY